MRSLSRIAEIRYAKDYKKVAEDVKREIEMEMREIEKKYAS